ncbi:hypothetical protein [Petroclostridium sp. X23]|uniref:hypothetical protein n=1 Tax=Petroclostridium sp. X23 TaxID=3045146 RepID=UPI0024ACDAAF|nr:hypothetical protein [Petroclostridium sp. X23]WHH57241.1 hypothetical protein QKW49_15520 [Petroclostridium sp. X23]
MVQKNIKKPLVQRILEANVLGDGNLYSVTPTDVLSKSFQSDISEQGNSDNNEEEK